MMLRSALVRGMLALSTLVAAATTTSAAPYELPRDFSVINPVGPWSFGYGQKPSAITLFQGVPIVKEALSNYQVGNNLVGASYYDFQLGTVAFNHRYLAIHPETGRKTFVQFKAPADGIYRFSGVIAILDSSPTGVAITVTAGAADITKDLFGVASPFKFNGKGSTGPIIRTGRSFGAFITLSVGTVVTFAVDCDGNVFNDTIGLQLAIAPTD